MGNRHHHKKLRAQVRAVMAEAGESYQRTLQRLRQERGSAIRGQLEVDLLRIDYFGTRQTLATFQILERLACVVLPSSSGPLPPTAQSRNPLFALGRRHTVH